MTPPPSAPAFSLDQVGEVVRSILRRKSGMSLRDDDPRADNVDALELFQEIIARLWERHAAIGDDAQAWSDTAAFAATVTHNAWSDYLRQRYPRRASLKNRLRYFLGHQAQYSVWETAHGEWLGGLRAWSIGGAEPVKPEAVQALRDGRARLPRGSVPGQDFEQFKAAEWDRLLGAIFAHLQAPVPIDALVALVATLTGLRETAVESLDTSPDGEEEGDLGQHADDAPTPEAQAETRGMLRQLWGALQALKPDYRRAYLLNLPGPGKTRGDIEVFLLHGIASIEEVFASLALDAIALRTALDGVELSARDHADLAAVSSDLERFCVLWRHLPLQDLVIARILGLEQQQVINRRMLALRELARLLTHRTERPRSAADAANRTPRASAGRI